MLLDVQVGEAVLVNTSEADARAAGADDLAISSARKIAAKKLIKEMIDGLRDAITGKFTRTEQDGWINTKAEAAAFLADNKAPAPSLRLQADIEGVTPKALAEGIIAAAAVTALLPNIAAGVRSKANAAIDDTDGSEAAIAAVTQKLLTVSAQIVTAAKDRDQKKLVAAIKSL